MDGQTLLRRVTRGLWMRFDGRSLVCMFSKHNCPMPSNRQLRSVRRSLTGEALRTLVHAFISSRVDYCNALLYGVADGVLRRLQSVLHAALSWSPASVQCSDITREQFKRSLKSWLFECAYGRRCVWETVQSEGAPKKWTYLLTYL